MAAGQATLAPDRLVFVDETWASTNRARATGRSPRGTPLVCAVPHSHGKTTTFVAALRADGLTAAETFDGAMTGDRFVNYVRRVLVPTRRPGDVVVWDNLVCHKRAEARATVGAAGATVRFLPPSSPDLNPIGLAFSKLKRMLRPAGKRTIPELWAFLEHRLTAFAPDECRAYLRHQGYGEASDATRKVNTV